ncbi:MAG: methyl-accepting chemotaxis protein [Spirochaetaceae bacterium]
MKLKISIKVLLPSLLVLFIGLISVSYIAHNTTKSLLNDNLINSTEFSLDIMVDRAIESRGQVGTITKIMSHNFTQVAKILSIYLGDRSEDLSSNDYIELAKNIGVDEIHVTDDKGVLRWGSVEGFFGFDFNTSEQTKPFLKILDDSSYSLAQEPQLRAVDNVLFQYISVSRLDKPGIVQIGMNASVLQEVTKRVDLQNIVDSFKVDDFGGSVFVIDSKGIVEKHKNRKLIGDNVVDNYDWGKYLIGKEFGSFYYTLEDTKKFMSYKKVGDSIFCASVFVAPYIEPVKQLDKILTMASLIVGVLLAIVIILLLRVLVGNPLNELNKKMMILAEGEGDLTNEIIVQSNDEVGELAISVNKFVSKLKYLIIDVKSAVVDSNAVKESIVGSTVESTTAVEEISSNLNSIGGQINTLDENINENATAIEQILSNVNSIDNQINDQAAMVEESTASITEMIASLKNVAQITLSKKETTKSLSKMANEGKNKIDETSSAFKQVVDQIQSIQEMATTINDIASQTNLLSMNAAIEAAHAGDAGKGFAVVADEIRKLAETSAGSSENITNMIKNITTSVSVADKNVDTTSLAFDSILHEISDTIDAFIEIESSVEELNIGGQQVLEASSHINDVTISIKSGSNEIKDGTKSMMVTSSKIQEVSEQVTQGMAESQTGAKEIVTSMQLMINYAKNLEVIVDELQNKFDAFKTE